MVDPLGQAARSRLEHAVGHTTPAERKAESVAFERGLAALAEYEHRHGHTQVPAGYVNEAGFPLGDWVAEQRLAHLEDRLPETRRNALEQVAGWRWDTAFHGR